MCVYRFGFQNTADAFLFIYFFNSTGEVHERGGNSDAFPSPLHTEFTPTTTKKKIQKTKRTKKAIINKPNNRCFKNIESNVSTISTTPYCTC